MNCINLLGGPGCGKSTIAGGLFHEMKLRGYKIELITEYAKDLVYEGRWVALRNQIPVLGEQMMRMERLRKKVDWVITDSPLLLSSVYASREHPQCFHETVLWAFGRNTNFNFFVDRPDGYQQWGRRESEESSRDVDSRILKLLDSRGIPYQRIKADPTCFLKIADLLPLPAIEEKP